ncbi:DegT/DnrJ/EryC1/StrS family aminotransferase [Shouchella lonarensis]|uniref:dTDP-4-amino-4,6-dideoxygalactose transaminase n=1 Tax=Shouchella lonarensis TaxID=1464122 RepID=A0A1G6L8T2_9BACI|nr:DegT/DnrJ/EryC1/StrS family aminotransferase [Shouchella lonarensis]SDC39195.1 dTDP-4-amino-4,6-dideoxygalactose transaminase [Shouchella lonarensis]
MIKLIKPYITYDDVKEEIEAIFKSGMFTKGPYVTRFRENLAHYVGASHTFLTTSATTALSVCLKLLGIKEGDEVIVSDFSFPATANVVENVGARPVFADVDVNTFNMSPEQLEAFISPKTKAVIFVDALGNPTGIKEIHDICRHYRIPLIDDAACALGSAEKGRRTGSLADLTCFSFHPRKLLTTGEGGAITTENEDWAAWLDVRLNHGAIFNQNKLDFVDTGYNYRLADIPCLLGLKQLEKLNEIIFHRNEMRTEYINQLAPLGFQIQQKGGDVTHNVQSLTFKVPVTMNRDQLMHHLFMQGIESTIGTYSLSHTTYYKRKYHSERKNALFLEQHTISLPCHEDVDVEKVVKEIRFYTKRERL